MSTYISSNYHLFFVFCFRPAIVVAICIQLLQILSAKILFLQEFGKVLALDNKYDQLLTWTQLMYILWRQQAPVPLAGASSTSSASSCSSSTLSSVSSLLWNESSLEWFLEYFSSGDSIGACWCAVLKSSTQVRYKLYDSYRARCGCSMLIVKGYYSGGTRYDCKT